MGETCALWCLVHGESKPFIVEVSADAKNFRLQELIQEKGANVLFAKDLLLWKPNDEINVTPSVSLPDRVPQLNEDSCQMLKAGDKVSKYFPLSTLEDHLHIIAQLPTDITQNVHHKPAASAELGDAVFFSTRPKSLETDYTKDSELAGAALTMFLSSVNATLFSVYRDIFDTKISNLGGTVQNDIYIPLGLSLLFALSSSGFYTLAFVTNTNRKGISWFHVVAFFFTLFSIALTFTESLVLILVLSGNIPSPFGMKVLIIWSTGGIVLLAVVFILYTYAIG